MVVKMNGLALGVGEFVHVHSLAVGCSGNVYVAKVETGKKIQRFGVARSQK